MESRYVIVTPAYNEAKLIVPTIESVLRQTIPPLTWVIIDDGSTDDTAAIIKSYTHRSPFIRYLCRKRVEKQSYFASNVHAIMEGVQSLRDVDYDFLAILDADITLPGDYYEQIFARFEADPVLGVASGIYENLVDGRLHRVLNDRRSTPKAIQVFRRACFEQIGGYVPLKYGGEDICTSVMARMQGWKAWSFPELKAVHRRPTGLGHTKSILCVRFRGGLVEHGLGSHPLFVLTKCLRRSLIEKPYLIGAGATLLGFLYASLRGEERQISQDVVRFVRREQLARVLRFNRIPSGHREPRTARRSDSSGEILNGATCGRRRGRSGRSSWPPG